MLQVQLLITYYFPGGLVNLNLCHLNVFRLGTAVHEGWTQYVEMHKCFLCRLMWQDRLPLPLLLFPFVLICSATIMPCTALISFITGCDLLVGWEIHQHLPVKCHKTILDVSVIVFWRRKKNIFILKNVPSSEVQKWVVECVHRKTTTYCSITVSSNNVLNLKCIINTNDVIYKIFNVCSVRFLLILNRFFMTASSSLRWSDWVCFLNLTCTFLGCRPVTAFTCAQITNGYGYG